MKSVKTLLHLLRVNNYIKNVLIFFPAFFGKKEITFQSATELVMGFLIFSLLSSSIYIINDLSDVRSDRIHPQKKFRPIAAGDISRSSAILICILLLITSFLLSFFYLTEMAILLLVFYLFFNLLYTFLLKHLLIIEFYSIAIFFEIRLFYGGTIADIQVSHWLALTVFFLATLIAVGKRRDDVLLQEQSVQDIRTNTRSYNIGFFNAIITVISSLLVFIYIIYSVSDWVIINYSEYFYITDIFVILGLSKYLHLIFVEYRSGNPVRILFEDRLLLICVLLWLVFVFKFIYYG